MNVLQQGGNKYQIQSNFWRKMSAKSKRTKESIPDMVDVESTSTPPSNNSDELTPEERQKIIENAKRNLTEIFDKADVVLDSLRCDNCKECPKFPTDTDVISEEFYKVKSCDHKLCATCYGTGKMRKCPVLHCQNTKLKPSDVNKDLFTASLIHEIQKVVAILHIFHDPNAKPRVVDDIALEELGSLAAEISNDRNSEVKIIVDANYKKRSSNRGASRRSIETNEENTTAGCSKDDTERMDQELEIPPNKRAKKTNQKGLIKCSLKEKNKSSAQDAPVENTIDVDLDETCIPEVEKPTKKSTKRKKRKRSDSKTSTPELEDENSGELPATPEPLSPIKKRTSISPIPDGKLEYCGNSASSSSSSGENDIVTDTAKKEKEKLPLPQLPSTSRNINESKRLSDNESVKKSHSSLGKRPITLDSSDSKGDSDIFPPTQFSPPKKRFTKRKSSGQYSSTKIQNQPAEVTKQPIALDSSDSKGSPDELPPTQYSPPKSRLTKMKKSMRSSHETENETAAKKGANQPNTLDPLSDKGSSDELSATVRLPQSREKTLTDSVLFNSDSKDDEPFVKKQGPNKPAAKTQNSLPKNPSTKSKKSIESPSAKKLANQPNNLDPSSDKGSSDELSATVRLPQGREKTLTDSVLFNSDSKDDEPFVMKRGTNKTATKKSQQKQDEILPPTQPLVVLKKVDRNKTNDSYLFKNDSEDEGPTFTKPETKKSKAPKKSLDKPTQKKEGGPSLISILPTQPLTEPDNDAKENEPKVSKKVPTTSSAKKPLSKQDMNKLRKKNHKGETMLHAACVKADYAKVIQLLDEGAEANTQDNNGWTPLHEVASNRGALNIVKALLDHNANPNVPGGKDHFTPLHDAASAGCIDICKILIQRGASKIARDSSGCVPSDLAKDDETKKAIDETVCDMTNTEQLDATIALNESAAPQKFVLFCHELESKDIALVKDNAKNLDYTFAKKMNEEVTHIVTSIDRTRMTVPEDLIYYTAIVMGVHIVDVEWFKESLNINRFIEEKEHNAKGCHGYPINALELSRANNAQMKPKLFDGCYFYFQGRFSKEMSKDAYMTLVKLGGGEVLKREPDPERISPGEHKYPHHAPEDSPLAKCSHYILYVAGEKEPKLKYSMNHLQSLPTQWVLESVKAFSLVEPFK